MNDLIQVLTWAAVILLLVIVGLAVFCWREVNRNDDMAAELDQARHDLATTEAARDAALYRAGRLERRLARLERDDATRSRRTAGYIDMPTINGKRLV